MKIKRGKGDTKMEKKDEEEFLKLVTAMGTKKILELLDEYGTVQYKKMAEFMSTHTLNARLRKLLHFNLIEHHYEKEIRRKEWYKITDTGKKILQELRDLIADME